jgi:hypothetical protein
MSRVLTSVRGGILIDKLSFLKAGFDGGSVSPEEERLMQLFQNRAGLKKAYADLKDELHLLRDRLKQQEGATTRVQEQLDALGELLGDVQSGFGAMVFFQLRALWKTCHELLGAFATELTKQQEVREVAKHQSEGQAIRNLRLGSIDDRYRAAAAEADEQRLKLNQAQRELGELTAFWHYFERRRRQKAIDSMRAALVASDASVGDLHAERTVIENEPLPEFPGLSLGARRNVNLAVIAYAELLCEQVDAHQLVARAKEAMSRRVGDMNFGDRAECESYMQRVQTASAAVTGHKQVNASVKLKLDRLRATCEYRNSADTVPTADSLAPKSAAPGWNVLAEDYWDVYTLLLR